MGTKEEKAMIRFNCILLSGIVLLVVMVFIFNSTTIAESENVATGSLMASESVVTQSAVSTPSSIATSNAVTASTSSSISSDKDEKEKKEQQRKKKLKEQRRKKRLMQKKRAEKRRKKLLERKRAQQKKITKAKAKVYSYTNQELLTLGKIIYEEARGESYQGKVAVGAVAMNRLQTKSKEFGAENGNLLEVLLKKWAFAEITISDEEFRASVYYDDCIKAAKAAFNGEDPTREYFPNGALFFYDTTVQLSERQTRYRQGIDTYQIGVHAFHIELNDNN